MVKLYDQAKYKGFHIVITKSINLCSDFGQRKLKEAKEKFDMENPPSTF